MGIPSYFRHILTRYPGLLQGIKDDFKSDILLVDFNCLIYGCVHSPSMPPYRESERAEWESRLLEEIKTYVVKIWVTAGRPAHVRLCVDGVVPMAKIKQQRLRRFKSVWLADKEREYGVRVAGQESWDTNSITPGTEFMEKLTVSLKALCAARGAGWVVSGAEEFGEGEQKLMEWVRSKGDSIGKKHITVYGLDADLIVLCLLHAGTVAKEAEWTIVREAQEFGGRGAKPTHDFLGLNCQGLLKILFPSEGTRAAELRDYVCGMTLLGNDFLPHSLGINIREGGHDRLNHVLAQLHKEGKYLVDASGCIIPGTLAQILEGFAETEEADIAAAFDKKYSMRAQPPRSESERAMLPVQNLPLEWAEEGRLWSKKQLTVDWKVRYYGDTLIQQDVHQRCMAYFQGLQWVLDYYTGRQPVSKEWMYAWTYPPLWSDLRLAIQGMDALPLAASVETPALEPQQQLSMVLPYESWGLIRNLALKVLPTVAPAFWPNSFDFESLGKRWLWECYPRIPILVPARLRSLLTSEEK
jgi:5'-3' exonuclease